MHLIMIHLITSLFLFTIIVTSSADIICRRKGFQRYEVGAALKAAEVLCTYNRHPRVVLTPLASLPAEIAALTIAIWLLDTGDI
jgi:hypothetical protein